MSPQEAPHGAVESEADATSDATSHRRTRHRYRARSAPPSWTRKSRGPVLLTYGQVGLPPGSLVDGEIHDPSAVTEAITKLWKNGQFSSSSVIVGIAGLRAITREIDLPFVPDAEVASAVRFQSEEVIPFPPDQTILSSQVLADYTSADGEKMRRVLVAAAHVDMVNGVIDCGRESRTHGRWRRSHLLRPCQGHR